MKQASLIQNQFTCRRLAYYFFRILRILYSVKQNKTKHPRNY